MAKDMWVNQNGTWRECTPWMNVNGTWKRATAAWVKVNDDWKQFYVSEYFYSIKSTLYNVNIQSLIGSPDADVIRIRIERGVNIRSNNPSVPALTIPDFPGKTVILENYGAIRGCGGPGGAGAGAGPYNGGPGGAGGTALRVLTSTPLQIHNYGTIAGGGGGGGGGGGAYLTGKVYWFGRIIASAGGGAGGRGGDGGYGGSGGGGGPTGYVVNMNRQTWVLGGAGGSGGIGGSAGASGARGGSTNVRPEYRDPGHPLLGSPGPGGAGGKSIEGASRVTFIVRGVIAGATSS